MYMYIPTHYYIFMKYMVRYIYCIYIYAQDKQKKKKYLVLSCFLLPPNSLIYTLYLPSIYMYIPTHYYIYCL